MVQILQILEKLEHLFDVFYNIFWSCIFKQFLLALSSKFPLEIERMNYVAVTKWGCRVSREINK